ncbi:MAG: hypothetical protein VB878_12755 [Pirellulaceae bacterium]
MNLVLHIRGRSVQVDQQAESEFLLPSTFFSTIRRRENSTVDNADTPDLYEQKETFFAKNTQQLARLTPPKSTGQSSRRQATNCSPNPVYVDFDGGWQSSNPPSALAKIGPVLLRVMVPRLMGRPPMGTLAVR